jgi:argininosuccinate lyase
MSLWGGRFNSGPNDSLIQLSKSVHFDWRLAPYEIEVNLAHLKNLENLSIISKGDGSKIRQALTDLAKEIGSGKFTFNSTDEDVHSAIERGLIEKCGPIGGAIRAGRSRNDLVVTDFKLYLIDHLLEIATAVTNLVIVLNIKAEENLQVVSPGFTHTQHAQPVTFAQELSKHSQALLRDIARIFDWLNRNSKSPFGAGALAGTSLVPQPEKIASELGFSSAMENSIDAVSDRDFVAEALFVFAMLGVHLSRIGEEFILWSSSEFKWVELSDQYTTGSSIMPQKKNADIAELARGKSGRFIGNLTSLLVVLKALPFGYNRDLQEDKEPIFDSVDQLLILLPAVTGMVESSRFNSDQISKTVLDDFTLATEIADYLAKKQVPFSQAHEAAGACVKLCEKLGVTLNELSDDQLSTIHPLLTSDLRLNLTINAAITSRSSTLGTAPSSVAAAISKMGKEINEIVSLISEHRKRFSGMISL